MLCDLLSAQVAVLEHNISTEAAIEHKHAARSAMRDLAGTTRRHLPELTDEAATTLVGATLFTAIAAWPCEHPAESMLAAYASDPVLAAMRPDFTTQVRRTTQLTAYGLLAELAQRPSSPSAP
ncbi:MULTISPECIES: hypothetical protein [Actinosynnema]|uniref:hypothetical protein n=1 Tax=Actinosynnema TaxID=40566 RepID=UPI0020A46DFF|nr:hypothetical protein [Actinosynnema pretiosum]MCP2098778.1 hypothetical protein [Actinosynnema pretiosum]